MEMEDLLDFGSEAVAQRATARTNALAVTRDYISQPRLSELAGGKAVKWLPI